MLTEENIVHQLQIEYKGGTINQDNRIGEREIRSFLQEHRPDVIRQAYRRDRVLGDSEFQDLGVLITTIEDMLYVVELPPIVMFPGYESIRLTSATGNAIPLMNKEDFVHSRRNRTTQFGTKAFYSGNKIHIFEGKSTDIGYGGTAGIDAEISAIQEKKVHVSCILQDPSDDPNYDWTSSPYPLNPDLIPILKNLIKKNNLFIMTEIKKDEVTNQKEDSVRYHDLGRTN
jgi:hypothetical protein